MENLIKDLIAIPEQEGQVLSIVGDTYRLVITGEQTGGAYAVIDMLVPPQSGPGPHAHAGIQEAFFVLEGEIEVKTEFQTTTARQGTLVNIPMGGVVHCFKNKTNMTVHMLCIVTPAGLEKFFQEIGTPIPAGTFLPPPKIGPKDLKRLQEIAEKYGQKLFPPDYLDK